jgi:hypothetical protein
MKSNVSLFKPTRSPFWYLRWDDESGRPRQKTHAAKTKGKHTSSFPILKPLPKKNKNQFSSRPLQLSLRRRMLEFCRLEHRKYIAM